MNTPGVDGMNGNNSGGGGGGGGNVPDIPMPPSSLPGGFDIPMPPSNKPVDGSATFVNTNKLTSTDAGGDPDAAAAAALAASLESADVNNNIPIVPAKPVLPEDGKGGEFDNGGGSGGVPEIPMPPMASPVIPDEGKSSGNSNGGDDGSGSSGSGVPSLTRFKHDSLPCKEMILDQLYSMTLLV